MDDVSYLLWNITWKHVFNISFFKLNNMGGFLYWARQYAIDFVFTLFLGQLVESDFRLHFFKMLNHIHSNFFCTISIVFLVTKKHWITAVTVVQGSQSPFWACNLVLKDVCIAWVWFWVWLLLPRTSRLQCQSWDRESKERKSSFLGLLLTIRWTVIVCKLSKRALQPSSQYVFKLNID